MDILSNTYPGGFKDSVASDAILEQVGGCLEEIEYRVSNDMIVSTKGHPK